jgi:hypothetical protein
MTVDIREVCCEHERWLERAEEHVQWQDLVLALWAQVGDVSSLV